jgi:hypothetical protein
MASPSELINPENIGCLVRLNGMFLDEKNIRGIKRDGANTRLVFTHGDDMLVAQPFDKVKALFPKVK